MLRAVPQFPPPHSKRRERSPDCTLTPTPDRGRDYHPCEEHAINHGKTKINIIDTPGHTPLRCESSDPPDGPTEPSCSSTPARGPMLRPVRPPQGISRKRSGHRRDPTISTVPDLAPNEVLNEVFELLVDLWARRAQLDFPYIFSSGTGGFASHDPHATSGDNQAACSTSSSERVPGPEVDLTPASDALHYARPFSE